MGVLMGSDLDDVGSPRPPPPPPPSPPRDTMAASLDMPPPLPISSSVEPVAPPSDQPQAPKRLEYRDLFALFHAEPSANPDEDAHAWENMRQLALVEAREEFRLAQLERKTQKKESDQSLSAGASTPSRGAMSSRHAMNTSAGNSVTSSSSSSSGTLGGPDKRPRVPVAGESDPNKAMRLNRTQNRPVKGKLMQKLGSRGI